MATGWFVSILEPVVASLDIRIRVTQSKSRMGCGVKDKYGYENPLLQRKKNIKMEAKRPLEYKLSMRTR